MAEPAPEPANALWPRLERRVAWALLASVVLGVGAVGQHRMLESDVFWHLHQGRAVLRHMARVVPEPTAFPELATHTPVAAWLWDVIAFLVYDASGPSGLSALTTLCGLLAAGAVLWMLRATCPSAPAAAQLLVGSVALTALTSRTRARPEVAALIMLPLLVAALAWFVRVVSSAAEGAGPRSRAARGFGALALLAALLWAQLHGSFLLALPIGVAFLAPALFVMRRDRARRTALLALGLGLLLASLTSTAGLSLFSYGSEHASLDIKLHNTEMHPPTWGSFNPLSSVFGPLFPLLLGLSAAGALVRYGARRASAGHAVTRERVEPEGTPELGPALLLLVLLALAVATQSVRFLVTATVLTAPLALRGASSLLEGVAPRVRTLALVLSFALSAFVFARALDRAQTSIGPLGRTGLAEHALPLAAAGYLKRAPTGTRALTAYDAGGILGLLLDGHARTFVDSRTMVLFDDVQFAVARDVFRSRAALERASRRYRAEVIVLPRASALCRELGAPWQPVAVDPQWTTWSRLPHAAALTAIAPCGGQFLTRAACVDERRALQRELAYLRALHPSPLLSFIEASALHGCVGDPVAARRALPSRTDAEGFEVARDLFAAELDLVETHGRHAVELVGGWAARGDLAAWALLQRALGEGGVDPATLLPTARAAVARFDDRAPPFLRELLAMLCTEVGDARCAYFHGLRAALEGSPNADAILAWLSTQHPDPKVRADAAAFRRALAAERAAPPRP